ncbi:hypothetical protein MtrunA17_Chr2g0313991 [Medicago truncatula]|uniref:Uncharacterized protein n=1 Tax=Medicago truncatula TaxID=3880 RepID=A0A396J932_MEDTR|nr:hypothetical protein MtrunA17_Chr2g0313991 [Medicago truncatula]
MHEYEDLYDPDKFIHKGKVKPPRHNSDNPSNEGKVKIIQPQSQSLDNSSTEASTM